MLQGQILGAEAGVGGGEGGVGVAPGAQLGQSELEVHHSFLPAAELNKNLASGFAEIGVVGKLLEG